MRGGVDGVEWWRFVTCGRKTPPAGGLIVISMAYTLSGKTVLSGAQRVCLGGLDLFVVAIIVHYPVQACGCELRWVRFLGCYLLFAFLSGLVWVCVHGLMFPFFVV